MAKKCRIKQHIMKVLIYLIWTGSTMNMAFYFLGIALGIQYSWWIHWLMFIDTVIFLVFGDLTGE